MIKVKRIYDKPEILDGLRILVDRLWPRGVRHSTANVDIWLKNVGPSHELRKWFAHDPAKWKEFKQRYKEELKDNPAFMKLIDLSRANDTVTLLYASRDEAHNQALVLRDELIKALAKAPQRSLEHVYKKII
ncbi:MAG: DUF488 family protein [Candidatus Marsarchaeota archaeon]|nr:DUF488 family protein [Candidatus Marsarchaeota archaeon]